MENSGIIDQVVRAAVVKVEQNKYGRRKDTGSNFDNRA
jgi:hypothetical protein